MVDLVSMADQRHRIRRQLAGLQGADIPCTYQTVTITRENVLCDLLVAEEAEGRNIVLVQEFRFVSVSVKGVIGNKVLQRPIILLEVIQVVLCGLLHDDIVDSLALSMMLND